MPAPSEPTFGDVWPGTWAYVYVECLVSQGIDVALPDGLFHPSEPVNDYDAAEWLGAATGTYLVPSQMPPCDPEGEVFEMWERTGLYASRLSVDPADGSCWVACDEPDVAAMIVHIAENGTELWRSTAYYGPVAVDHSDGSCWTTALDPYQLVLLDRHGAELSRVPAVANPGPDICVNQADRSLWAVDADTDVPMYEASEDDIVRLARDAGQRMRVSPFDNASSLSVNPADGSCWVGVAGHRVEHGGWVGSALVHLDKNGGQLWSGDYWAGGVSVDARDGSCWAGLPDGVVHLASNGTELWRGYYVGGPPRCVDPSDGSCWVADHERRRVVHIVRPGYRPPVFCDVASYHWARGAIETCYNAGIVAGYPDGSYQPTNPVTRAQMAVYVARALAGGDENVPPGPDTPTFSDVPTDHWAYRYVEYCYAHNVVEGYTQDDPDTSENEATYAPDLDVNRAAMAAYIARALVGGDENVPPGPLEATFDDVPTSHWAYDYVEYCVAEGIVQGFDPDTYAPDLEVTRDQMAVYIARAFQLPL